MNDPQHIVTEPTLGQALVGYKFNPSGDSKVDTVKALFAQIIDIINSNDNQDDLGNTIDEEAIGHAVTAQMWAVKAITWKAP